MWLVFFISWRITGRKYNRAAKRVARKGDAFMFPMIDKKETGINLRRIMDMRGITAKDVQQYLDLGCVQSVYRWLDGINMPTIDNLYALSELFQVPIDDIVRGNRAPMLQNLNVQTLDSCGRRLFQYYEKIQKLQAA